MSNTFLPYYDPAVVRRPKRLPFLVVLCVIIGLLASGKAYGQRVYATVSEGNATSGTTITNLSSSQGASASSPPSTNIPTTLSTTGNTLSTNSGWVSLKFTNAVPTSLHVFVKFQNQSITTGSIKAEAFNGTSTLPVVGTQFTTIHASDGSFYYKVWAPTTFDRIRVTTTGGLLLGTATANISFAFYDVLTNDCGNGAFSSLNISGGTITNPSSATDGNLNTHSTFGIPLGLLANLQQNVHYTQLSNPNEVASVSLSVPPAFLSVGLLGSTDIKLYNGSTTVGNFQVAGLLQGTDLLGLLQSGGVAKISLTPTAPFDRVEVSLSTTLGIELGLNLYEVQRTPPKPTFNSTINDTVFICSGTNTTLSAITPIAGIEHVWFSTGLETENTPIAIGSLTTPTLSSATTYYVAARKINCSATSERVPVRVLIHPASLAPTSVTAVPDLICSGSSSAISVVSPLPNYSYRWYTSSSGGNYSYSGNSHNINLLNSTTFYVEGYNSITGCSSSGRTPVTITVNPLPTITASSPIYACAGSTSVSLPYIATSNTPTTYSITWGGSYGFNPIANDPLPTNSIPIIIPGTTTVGTYNGILTVRNNNNGTQCNSANNNFSIIIQAHPNATPVLTSFQ